MTITSRPQDKFAFLFSGPTLPRFMKDLENVYTVLINYYHYLPANVHVVLGSAPASLPAFAFTTVASPAALQMALDAFASGASGPVVVPGVDGNATTALLYFTGGGDNSTGTAKLVVDGALAGPGNTVNAAWLTARLSMFTGCHVNVVMQQSFAGGFSGVFGPLVAMPGWSFTSACGATQQAPGNNTEGSFFTYGWCKALRHEMLPAGTPDVGSYADTLGAGTDATDHLISTAEAMDFGKQIHDVLGFSAFATPAVSTSGAPQHLGRPKFLVRDGTPWWESPDIYLTHPNHPAVPAGDDYIPDAVGATAPYNNTITTVVRNLGTHPVRRYSLGVELFKTGTVPPTDQHTVSDKVPDAGLLMPIDAAAIGTPADRTDIAEWNTPFTIGTTHECIKAEAKLLASDVDYTWDIVARDFEGQRNTDQMALAPMTAKPTPLFEIQGFKQHEYGIHNRFDRPRRFAVLFPPEYPKATDAFELDWLENRDGQLTPVEVMMDPRPHIRMTIDAHATRNLVLRARSKRGATQQGEVRLPFTIAAEGEWPANRRPLDFRVTDTATAQIQFADVGGFTVVLRQAASTIKGKVLDRNGKPAARATVMVATVDGLQRVAVKTDDRGRYELANVNPDVYVVRTETDLLRSTDQTIFLGAGKVELTDLRLAQDIAPAGKHVKVVLDRIRIRKDYEPWFKGKADLSFTSEVVPDLDDSQKQITRLPKKGLVHASDRPGANDIEFDATLFDGFVKKNTLKIRIGGKEHDLLDPDERLKTYERAFSGNPDSWLGTYQPADEHFDPEDVGDWEVWYRIVSI